MIAFSLDTAEITVTTGTTSPSVPAALLDQAGGVPLSRAELRAQRRHARRQQRIYVLLGLSVLVGVFAATVLVLGVIR